MTLFIQQVIDGISVGAVYSLLALAVVLVHRSTGVANFAQGELAMLSAFIAWQFTLWGLPLWLAIVASILASIALGMLLERGLVRPVYNASPLALVILTLGLLLVVNQSAGFIWGSEIKQFPSLFPDTVFRLGDVRIPADSIGVLGVLVVAALLLYLLFQHTKIGLAMRAASTNREASRLVGVSVSAMFMLGWGLSAGLGALAGVLTAPRLFLEPNMMLGVLLFAFAAATLGGINSPVGAIVGGLIVGVSENLAGTYVDFIGSDLKIVVPLFIIVVVLVVKPDGLFGKKEVVRV
jgi:branched-chain amino acid transport system permease protein